MMRTVLAIAMVSAISTALPTPSELVSVTAPDTFHAKFTTGKPEGEVIVEVHRNWSPKGADRFYGLVKSGFFNDARVFRNVPHFVAQFGINGDPQVQSQWRSATIQDDPKEQSNARGTLVFATSGPNSRTTQMFFNKNDNQFLDSQGFTPIGKVMGNGMDVIDALQEKYGEKPDQTKIQTDGNAYLKQAFPDLSFFSKVELTQPEEAKEELVQTEQIDSKAALSRLDFDSSPEQEMTFGDEWTPESDAMEEELLQEAPEDDEPKLKMKPMEEHPMIVADEMWDALY